MPPPFMDTYSVVLEDTRQMEDEADMLKCLVCDKKLAHDFGGLEAHYQNFHRVIRGEMSEVTKQKLIREAKVQRGEQRLGWWHFIGGTH